ncbi:hypothetical protein D1AOALGA4SA_8843, partial [Olavius algarvensis Delta 1 endosymbiont]
MRIFTFMRPLYSLNQQKIEQEKKFDGIFVLLSSRYDLKPREVV